MIRDPEDGGMASFIDSPPELVRRRLSAGEKLVLIDVREPDEWTLCRLEGARLLPMSNMSDWEHLLDPRGGPYVIYCHHGIRSRFACQRLAAAGLRGLINMTGGIDAWSRRVDPSLPTY